MFRIRRIFDDIIPANRDALRQVKDIIRKRFSEASEEDIDQIGIKLRNPFKQRFRPILFVEENMRRRVLGFALVLHEPEINFCYLDWIATAREINRGGLGSALYERIRRESAALKVKGLFFECLSDDPDICPNLDILKVNALRLRFYERYGARPVINTAYEAPINPGDTCMPHLIFDGLQHNTSLSRSFARKVVRAILERKYKYLCPQEYVEKVVASFQDNPVKLRPLQYIKPEAVITKTEGKSGEQIALILNNHHEILHIHERGYVESPVRVRSILKELEKSGLFETIEAKKFPDRHIHAVHDADFITYLRKACEQMDEGKSLYPYVFPIRNKTRPPVEPTVLPGYYCIDTFTPINRNAWPAARAGVNAALTAAKSILDGRRIAYALIRPPGHHAERRAFGGFCYFNNTAIAAQYLRMHGRVAVLDIDYHHGNGQQDIFYNRSDVLTVSIHGDPKFAYPYFTGFEDEFGKDEGEGFNLNIPLKESINGLQYKKALKCALLRISEFEPDFLVVALGLDTAKRDPTGTWSLTPKDFRINGQMIGETGLPIAVIQEGGYRTRTLGTNALNFFQGMAETVFRITARKSGPETRLQGVSIHYEPVFQDIDRIRKLVELTGFFTPEEINMAGDLVRERLEKGPESGYNFVFAWQYGRLVGYGCYGFIACTRSSHDIYWIAVSPDFQGRGLGKMILNEMEKLIKESGGTRAYVETSMQQRYAATRSFYEKCGYRRETVLDDFYGPGDGKAIYCKTIAILTKTEQ